MEFIIEYSRYIFPCLAVIILLGCCSSLFSKRPKIKTVAFLVNAKSGESVPVNYWETSIGRSNSCDIVLSFNTVSRFHAVLTKQKKGWVITDTLSKTGTYINGRKINEPSVIKDGDVLNFGSTALIFKER